MTSRLHATRDTTASGVITEDQSWARRRPAYWAEKLKLEASDAIIDTMDESHVSRSELARRLGTSPSFITKVLSGYHNLSLDTIAKIGCALGIQWQLVSAPVDVSMKTYVLIQSLEMDTVSPSVETGSPQTIERWTLAPILPLHMKATAWS